MRHAAPGSTARVARMADLRADHFDRDAALAKVVLYLARHPNANEEDLIQFASVRRRDRERVETLLFHLVTEAKLLRWTNDPKQLGTELRYALAARVVSKPAIEQREHARALLVAARDKLFSRNEDGRPMNQTVIRSCRWYRRPYGPWRIDTWKLCFDRSERIRVFGT